MRQPPEIQSPHFITDCLFRQRRLDHKRTLHTLALELAADVVGVPDRPVEIVGIRRAAAAAVELRETAAALLLRVDVAALELVPDLRYFSIPTN